MSKAEWGVKRLCGTCATPFYDLHHYPIRCPKCDAEFRPAAALGRSGASKSKRATPTRRGQPKVAPVPAEERVQPVAGSAPLRATDVEEEADADSDGEDALLDTDDDDVEDDDTEDAAAAEPDDDAADEAADER